MNDGTLIIENIKEKKYDCDIKTLIGGHWFTKFRCWLLNTIYSLQEKCYLKNIFKKNKKMFKNRLFV